MTPPLEDFYRETGALTVGVSPLGNQAIAPLPILEDLQCKNLAIPIDTNSFGNSLENITLASIVTIPNNNPPSRTGHSIEVLVCGGQFFIPIYNGNAKLGRPRKRAAPKEKFFRCHFS